MSHFLKVFLSGIIYVLLSPVILLVLAIYAAYCLIVFIYMAIRCLIVFFSGGNPLGDLKEDVDAKKILKERELAPANPVQPQINNFYGPMPQAYPPENPEYGPNPFLNNDPVQSEESGNEDEIRDEEVDL